MPLFRCLKCMKEFEAAKPACADCGLDPAKNSRHKDYLVALVLHHFDPPSGVEGIGLGHAACDKKIKIGAPKCSFTGYPPAVNCKACMATAEFAAADPDGNGVQDIPLKPLSK